MIRLNKIYLLFLTLGFSGISLFSQTEGAVGDAEAGKKLWVSSNCGSCHQVHKKTVGPALKRCTRSSLYRLDCRMGSE